MIATFNSAKILPKVLDAIKQQDYSADKIEILAIDGGSSDNTRELAESYGCIVLDNPKTNPVEAKMIGIKNAHGKYLITIDHDEVLENPRSISIRVNTLENHPNCKVAMCSGYKRPNDYPLLNQYISEFGDPFTLFFYNFPKDHNFFIKTLRNNYSVVEECDEYIIVSFENYRKPIILEMICASNVINLDYFRSLVDFDSEAEIAHMFYLMLDDKHYQIVVSKNDPLVHYSADSLRAYFPKIKWRICNNVHYAQQSEAGFLGRNTYSGESGIKKYLFIPYTIIIPIAFTHAIYLSVSRKNAIYLLHPFLCIYTLFQIGLQMTLKFVGVSPVRRSYDGKKKVGD